MLRNIYKKKIFYLCVLMFLLTFIETRGVYAQSFPPLQGGGAPTSVGTIQVSISPLRPRPNQQVLLSVDSFSFDIQRSNISWYQNGVLVPSASGLGKTRLAIIAGDVGSTDSIRVTVEPPGRSAIEKTITIRPSDVLLLWQAESYTPPFYRGKAMRSPEGDVTVLAIPDIIENGSRITSESLIFTWEQDGVVLGSLSGLGRDTLSVGGSLILQPVTISVEVETLSGDTRAKRSVQIPVTEPRLHVYENHPTLGINFDRALTNNTLQLRNEEAVLEAIPYFFSSLQRSTGLSYEWKLNNNVIGSTSEPKLTVRHGNNTGKALLSVSVSNRFSFFESALSEIVIAFGL